MLMDDVMGVRDWWRSLTKRCNWSRECGVFGILRWIFINLCGMIGITSNKGEKRNWRTNFYCICNHSRWDSLSGGFVKWNFVMILQLKRESDVVWYGVYVGVCVFRVLCINKITINWHPNHLAKFSSECFLFSLIMYTKCVSRISCNIPLLSKFLTANCL